MLREAHSGVCVARNRGVAEANGEVVIFLDADDVADRDWLATFADAFDRHPNLGLAVLRRAGGDGRPTRTGRCFLRTAVACSAITNVSSWPGTYARADRC